MCRLSPPPTVARLVVVLTAIVAVALALPRPTAAESPSVGQVEERMLDVAATGQWVRHLVFTPSAYDPSADRRWPLIVGLHGTAGHPEQVMDFQRLRELAERYGYLIVCPHSSGRGALHRRYVLDVVADTERHYRVDSHRIVLLGFSRGGGGVWGLGAHHPGRWAALAPIAPATPTDPAPLDTMRGIPVVVVVGDRDRAVSRRSIRRWVGRMAELGMVHQFIELPGIEHDLSRVDFLPLIFAFFERHAGVSRTPDRPRRTPS